MYVDKAVFISRRKPYQAGCISRTRSAKSVKGSLSTDRTSDVILSRLHAPGLLATSQQLSNPPTFSGWHRVLGLLNETTYLPTLFHFISSETLPSLKEPSSTTPRCAAGRGGRGPPPPASSVLAPRNSFPFCGPLFRPFHPYNYPFFILVIAQSITHFSLS